MTTQPKLKAVLAAALLVFGTQAVAEDSAPSVQTDSGWEITVAPYLWASGISGSSGLFGFPPQQVDVSFSDVVENLKFGFMGAGEARKGRLSFGVDLVYANLEANIDTPVGVPASSINAKIKNLALTTVAGYSVVYQENATVDLVGGLRFWSVDNDFTFNGGLLDGTKASDGDEWTDPIVGAKFRTAISPNLYLTGWGLVGGFGSGSDTLWDVMAGVSYRKSERMSFFGGFRAMGVDYSNDGFVFDVIQRGPVIGGVFHF